MHYAATPEDEHFKKTKITVKSSSVTVSRLFLSCVSSEQLNGSNSSPCSHDRRCFTTVSSDKPTSFASAVANGDVTSKKKIKSEAAQPFYVGMPAHRYLTAFQFQLLQGLFAGPISP